MNQNAASSSQSDEELIKAYFDEDNHSLLELIGRYISIIDQKIAAYHYLRMETEDIKQEALVSLLDAVKTYDVDAGTLFRTYAGRCIDNSIKNSLAKLNTRKAKLLSDALSIDGVPDRDVVQARHDNPEQMYIDKEKYQRLVDLIDGNLSAFEKDVLFRSLEGDSYADMSRILDSTPKAVDNALQRVRKKLKMLFE